MEWSRITGTNPLDATSKTSHRMKNRKYVQQVESEPDGYTPWIYPVMDDYRIACCGCGLVHDFKFQVDKVVKRNANGTFSAKPASESYVVKFKAKQNRRATAARKRNK